MKNIQKKFTAALISASMIGSAALAATFSDINESQYSWAKPYIIQMADAGYITGYDNGTFGPDNEVTNLEAIALFARQMGALKDENKQILARAHEQYDETLKAYKLSWGSDELAFMLYKGALKKSDLDTYIASGRADSPMKRYEAAIIITKAMNGEQEATSQTGVSLDYTDKNEIPSNAIQYVNYVTQKEIMQGMENGGFSPRTSVMRSQMAVMLARVVEKTDYKFETVHIESISDDGTSLTVKNSKNETEVYAVSASTEFKVKGEAIQVKDMLTNVDAVITLSGKNLICVDTLSSNPNKTVTGKFSGKMLSGGVTTIKITPAGSSQPESYVCAESMTVTYQGSPATLNSIATNDTITVSIVDGKVTSVVGAPKSTTISNAVVEDIIIGDSTVALKISHANSEYDGMTYTVADNVSVKKDSTTTTLSKIYKGDRVTLTLDYGEVTKITATSTLTTVEGTLKEIKLASQSSIVVSRDGTDYEYSITTDTKMTRDEKEATLYDFRVGDRVKVVLESNAVKTISTVSVVSTEGSMTGKVEAINTSFGFLSIVPTGETASQTVFYHANKVTVLNKLGAAKNVSNIKVGDTVYVTGTVSSGAFTASVIIITTD